MEDENRKYNQEKLISHEVRCYNCQNYRRSISLQQDLWGRMKICPMVLRL